MSTIRYGNKSFELAENQSVLDCLNGHGVPIPFSSASAFAKPA